jgi:hypothetical protein
MEKTQNNRQDYLNETLNQTRTAITKFFDTVDKIDQKFYGRRMKFFIWGCLLVLLIAPFLDEILGVQEDKLTYYSTFLFFIFLLVILLAFVGSWRDDTGNWSFIRAKSRIQTYYDTLKDSIEETKTSPQDENLYTLGHFLVFGGIAWKALQNISVFIRKPIEELFSTRFASLRKIEMFTKHYYLLPILIGLCLIIYLCNKNPKILVRIKKELRELFGWDIYNSKTYKNEDLDIDSTNISGMVVNAKSGQEINNIKIATNSNLFSDFATALLNWNPRGAYYEYEYQDRLYRHLRKNMPYAKVELEYPIGNRGVGKKGRADIVINDKILIEMKRDSSAGAIQRAKGQVYQYTDIWSNKGPVVLLLCDYEYEHAKTAFSSTMTDLAKLNRPAITIVAKPK